MKKNISLFGVFSTNNLGEIISNIINSGQIATGHYTKEFADAFGKLTGQKNVVTVNDMSNAIQIALRLSGVGIGDKVLTTSYACMSTNAPIATIGAKPVWVDVNPETGLMSPEALERSITPECKAVIAYHLAGYPVEIEKIAKICQRNNLKLIEDCDNALLATVNGKQVGSYGDFAVFSFYPNRQINATEGGALCCKNSADAVRATKLRRYGIDIPNFRDEDGEINPASDIPEAGWAATLNNICSAVGLTQLETVQSRINRCRDIAQQYTAAFQFVPGIETVIPVDGAQPAYWVYLLKIQNRDSALKLFKKAGLSVSKIHHLTNHYSCFDSREVDLPDSDQFFSKVLGLPCGWWLSAEDVDFIISTVLDINKAVNASI